MSIEMSKNKIHTNVVWSVAAAAFVAGFSIMFGCGEDENNNGTQDEQFECTTERDGWEQCVDNKVQYCHIVEGMDPHFHWAADCEALGYECVELNQSTAACLDESSSCTVGEFKCEDNTAYNCIDEDGHGHWAIEPCGTAKHCHEEADEAHCEEASGDE